MNERKFPSHRSQTGTTSSPSRCYANGRGGDALFSNEVFEMGDRFNEAEIFLNTKEGRERGRGVQKAFNF